MVIIPTLTDGSPYYTQSIELNGVTFNLYFEWNEILGRWRMSVLDTNDTMLIAGMTLVTGVKLNFGFAANPDHPQGSFVVLDSTSAFAPPGLYELGARCVLGFTPGE